MISWGDVEVSREQHRDRLLRAEKNRLIEQVTANQPRTELWSVVKNIFITRLWPCLRTAEKIKATRLSC